MRKTLETKLNGKNVIKAINTWAVALLRYSAAFLQWTRLEKEELDRRTRKLLTMHKGLHPRSNVDRVYIPRSEGGRGLQSVEDIIELAILGLQRYVQDSDERLIAAARGNEQKEFETEKELKEKKKNTRKEGLRQKMLHGQYDRQTEEVRGTDSWTWLKEGNIKRETENLIMSAQEQVLRTNQIKAKIDKTQKEGNCRMCGTIETVNHIVSECSKLVQKEHKGRHD